MTQWSRWRSLSAVLILLLLTASFLYAQSTSHQNTIRENFVNGIEVKGLTNSGFQHKRTALTTCATTGCTVAVTWPESFASTSYTPVCTIYDTLTVAENAGVRVAYVNAVSTSGLTVGLDNVGSTTTVSSAQLNCFGAAD
jgi:hypothetical protein